MTYSFDVLLILRINQPVETSRNKHGNPTTAFYSDVEYLSSIRKPHQAVFFTNDIVDPDELAIYRHIITQVCNPTIQVRDSNLPGLQEVNCIAADHVLVKTLILLLNAICVY